MTDEHELVQPGPVAPAEAWAAYRHAWSERAMEIRRQHLKKLNAELRAKVRYADCERALGAFNKVLSTAGVNPWDAVDAQFKLELWDNTGFPEDGGLTAEEGRAAAAWREAFEAARVELCDKAPFVSEKAFALVDFLGHEPARTFEHVFPLTLQTS